MEGKDLTAIAGSDFLARQQMLDVDKWLASERAGRDLCGTLSFCGFCVKGETNPCAKAEFRYKMREALDELAGLCDIAVVKLGPDGSMVKCGCEYHKIDAWPAATIDATGAGDLYAAGFMYAHAHGMPIKVCGEVGSIISAKVVEVIGPKVDIPRWKGAKQEIRNLMGINEN